MVRYHHGRCRMTSDSYWQFFVAPERYGYADLAPGATAQQRACREPLRRRLGVPDQWDPATTLHHPRPTVADFQYCFNMPFVVTERVREVIEPVLDPLDEVVWLPVTLELSTGERRTMYFIRPLVGPELVEDAASRHGPGGSPGSKMITVARFSRERVGSRQLFAYAYGSDPVVSPRVRTAVEGAGLTGLDEWSPVRLV
jgi:hypothetical protein